MSEDAKLWALGLVLGAALLGALGYAGHLSSVRNAAIRVECIKQGRVWAGVGCGQPIWLEGKQPR